MIKTCQFCNEQFETNRSIRKFCSKDCSAKYSKGVVTLPKKNCIGCGGEFQPRTKYRIYCSKECWKSTRKEARVNKCETCGKEYERLYIKQKYCSHDCYAENNKGENNWKYNNFTAHDERGYLRYTVSHPKYPRLYVHQVVWREANPNGKCNRCGGEVEHIHHRDENKSNNDIKNLEGLCRKCHLAHHIKYSDFWGRPKGIL